MIEKDTNENIEDIYSYKNLDGQKFWTPNALFAYARAQTLGTNIVYEEQYDVPAMAEKKKY